MTVIRTLQVNLIEVEPILSRIEPKEFYSAEHMLAGNKDET